MRPRRYTWGPSRLDRLEAWASRSRAGWFALALAYLGAAAVVAVGLLLATAAALLYLGPGQ